MKGRLSLKPDEATWFSANLAPPVSLVPLTSEISLTSCRLPDFHGDPADRHSGATDRHSSAADQYPRPTDGDGGATNRDRRAADGHRRAPDRHPPCGHGDDRTSFRRADDRRAAFRRPGGRW